MDKADMSEKMVKKREINSEKFNPFLLNFY